MFFVCLCSSKTMSRSSFRGVSLGGASPTAATLHDCRLAAAWGNSASPMSSSPPWSRTAVSVHATPAVRRSVRLQTKVEGWGSVVNFIKFESKTISECF